MNSENLNFFTNNGFSISDVSENVDTHIYSPMEVNKIVSDYRFQVGTSTRYVSIADIVGYDTSFHGNSSNIFDSMDYFLINMVLHIKKDLHKCLNIQKMISLKDFLILSKENLWH